MKKILYSDIKLSIMKNPCCDMILGHDFLWQYSSAEILFEGLKEWNQFLAFAA